MSGCFYSDAIAQGALNGNKKVTSLVRCAFNSNTVVELTAHRHIANIGI